MIGIVTRNIVLKVDAPATRAASSKAASILRKAGVRMITTVAEAPPNNVDEDDSPDAKDVEWSVVDKR